MEDLTLRRTPQTKAVRAWVRFAEASKTGKATQEMFWNAHQLSLHEGIALSSGLTSQMQARRTGVPSNELVFADHAVKLVDLAAIANLPTDTRTIEDTIFTKAYPQRYPASSARCIDNWGGRFLPSALDLGRSVAESPLALAQLDGTGLHEASPTAAQLQVSCFGSCRHCGCAPIEHVGRRMQRSTAGQTEPLPHRAFTGRSCKLPSNLACCSRAEYA